MPLSETEPPALLPSKQELLSQAWFDRDLGWLEFNRRVLNEAQDERTPLLERVKFLAIVGSNLDEFFMKRIGVLRGKADIDDDEDPEARAIDHVSHLAEVRRLVSEMLDAQARCYTESILPALERHGVVLARWDRLDEAQRAELGTYFDTHVSAALTPLSLDPTHPFPFMSNMSTNWGFLLRSPDDGEEVAARVKLPTVLPHWVSLRAAPPGQRWFVSLQEVIKHNAAKLFPGMEIHGPTLFRVLRDAGIDIDEQDDNRHEAVTESLQKRRFQPVVRVDFGADPHPLARQLLSERFALTDDDIYMPLALLDYTELFQIAGLDIPALRDAVFVPLLPTRLADKDVSVVTAIQVGPLLLHHPYESFEASVERFIAEASTDPQTIAIKMTVYRVGDDTPFVRSLIRAAEMGKQVACLVELQARFDEERNLHWAKELERAGAHVVYGVAGLKTHTKLALVVRKEGSGLRCYAHVGTGNYHSRTARMYTDLGLLTADTRVTGDVVNLFHFLTGRSRSPTFANLLVAPFNMRARTIEMIDREVAHARAGRPARIIAKMNQFDDVEIGRHLVQASRAGVPVDLLVRGFCCLRPGVEGWTDNLRVRSIIGRYLEHSRIVHFANGHADPADGDYYIGSADWMFRNLSRRVEAMAPIEPRPLRERLWEILDLALHDARQAWDMHPDGSYRQVKAASDADPHAVGMQARLIDLTRKRAAIGA